MHRERKLMIPILVLSRPCQCSQLGVFKCKTFKDLHGASYLTEIPSLFTTSLLVFLAKLRAHTSTCSSKTLLNGNPPFSLSGDVVAVGEVSVRNGRDAGKNCPIPFEPLRITFDHILADSLGVNCGTHLC